MLKAEVCTDAQIEDLKSEAEVLRKIPPHPNVLLYLGLFNEGASSIAYSVTRSFFFILFLFYFYYLVVFVMQFCVLIPQVVLTHAPGKEWGIVTELVAGGSLKKFLMANVPYLCSCCDVCTSDVCV